VNTLAEHGLIDGPTDRYADLGDGRVLHYRRRGRGWDDGTVERAPEGWAGAVAVESGPAAVLRAAQQHEPVRVADELPEILQRLTQAPPEGFRRASNAIGCGVDHCDGDWHYDADPAQVRRPAAWACPRGRRDLAVEAGVPQELRDVVASCDRPRAERPVTGWANGRRLALFLWGDGGAGKSVCAAAWLAWAGGAWCWCDDLADAIQPDESGAGKARLRRWGAARALVLDDLSERLSQRARERASSLILGHLQQSRRVVITARRRDALTLLDRRVLDRWRSQGAIVEVVAPVEVPDGQR